MRARTLPLPDLARAAQEIIPAANKVRKEGLATQDELGLALFELLTHSDITYRQHLARSLGSYLISIAKNRDLERLRLLSTALELVIRHVEAGRPYDAAGMLVAQYVIAAASRGEKLSKERMRQFIEERAPDRNDVRQADYERILRRFGRAPS